MQAWYLAGCCQPMLHGFCTRTAHAQTEGLQIQLMGLRLHITSLTAPPDLLQGRECHSAREQQCPTKQQQQQHPGRPLLLPLRHHKRLCWILPLLLLLLLLLLWLQHLQQLLLHSVVAAP
jgi:hypothetical protein